MFMKDFEQDRTGRFRLHYLLNSLERAIILFVMVIVGIGGYVLGTRSRPLSTPSSRKQANSVRSPQTIAGPDSGSSSLTIVLPSVTPSNPISPSSEIRTSDVSIEQKVISVAWQDLSKTDECKAQHSSSYSTVSGVKIQEDWAVIYYVRQSCSTDQIVATEPGISLAHYSGSQWAISNPGDPTWESWLDRLPESLINKSDKVYLR